MDKKKEITKIIIETENGQKELIIDGKILAMMTLLQSKNDDSYIFENDICILGD